MHLLVNDQIHLTEFRPSDKAARVQHLGDREIYDRTIRIPYPYTEADFDNWLEITVMEAVIFIGLQAAGKSTFYLRRFFRTHVRINMDMLGTKHRERLLLDACLAGKQAFVIDKVNAAVADRAPYIHFNDLPNCPKRGVGLYWEQFDKIGTNPVTGQSVIGPRRRLKRDFDLPMKDDDGRFIAGLICGGGVGSDSN